MPETGALYRLLSWLTPLFPLETARMDQGLEDAVASGVLVDRETLVAWSRGILEYGAASFDAVVFAAAWRAARRSDLSALENVCDFAVSLSGDAHRALDSTQQGDAFLQAVMRTWPESGLMRTVDRLRKRDHVVAHPIAVALVCYDSDVALEHGLLAYLHAYVSHIVLKARRLIPLDIKDGQRAIGMLEMDVLRAARIARTRTPAEIGAILSRQPGEASDPDDLTGQPLRH